MKNSFFKQFHTESQKIRLRGAERSAMRLQLEQNMRLHPLIKIPVRMTGSPIVFFTPRLVSSLAFVLILAIVGSGTAYAAEGAVPGDFLYSVKLNVNERIVTGLAQSAPARAEVHARLAERRMEEAQVLTVRGALTVSLKAALEENFEKHAAEVETIVGAVEREDPVVAADISARFSSSLEAHSALIARLAEGEENEESKRESKNLSRALRERGGRLARADAPSGKTERARALEHTQSVQDDTEAFLAVLPEESVDAEVISRIELTASTTLEEADNLLAALYDRLGATTSARTKDQISAIRDLVKRLREGRNGSFKDERKGVERALREAVKVKTFIKAQEKFREHTLLPLDFDEDEDDQRDNESGHSEKKEGQED